MDNNAMIPKKKKSVQWGDVVVAEHPIVLGDNPSPLKGPALSVSWKPQQSTIWSVIDFEFSKSTQVPRRSREELVLSAADRNKVLLRQGYSVTEIVRASMVADEIKASRINSLKKSGHFSSGFQAVLAKALNFKQHRKTPFMSSPNAPPAIIALTNSQKLAFHLIVSKSA